MWRAFADGRNSLQIKRNFGFVGNRQNVENGVGRAAHGHVEHH